jgi:CRP-like cAMP-binding protein
MATTTLVPVLSQPVQYTFARQDLIPLQPETLWQIERGVVRTATWNDEGVMIPLGFWGPGDVIGRPLTRMNPYQIECLTSVEAILLPPPYWHQSLEALLLHVQQSEELLLIVNSRGVATRLLKFLGWLAHKFGRPVHQGCLIDLRLTHQEIAEVLGTSRVTITRLLNQFEQQCLIHRSRRYLTLVTGPQVLETLTSGRGR